VADTAATAALQRPLSLAGLPAAWGKDSKYDMSQGAGAGTVVPVDGAKSFEPTGVTVTAKGESWTVAPGEKEMTLKLSNKADVAKRANVLVLQLTVPVELQGKTATLAWGEKASGRTVTFTLVGDGASHPYVIRLGAVPAWVLAGDVAALQLTVPGGGWTWEKGQWLALQDIPQIKTAAPKTAVPDDKAKKDEKKGTPGKPVEKK
jgi:hypothetical protein